MVPPFRESAGRYAPNAPRVALLLYADDILILAEDAGQLQKAGASGSQWRFFFGIGPDKFLLSWLSVPGRFIIVSCVKARCCLVYASTRTWT